MKDAAILFLTIVAVGLAVIMWRQHPAPQVAADKPHPIAPASDPASQVPWRLLTICPVNQRNVPRYRERTA
jgi:hypothetical protein